nr:MAG TPA: hypothetical protein [Caudoviricetes sp.]
MAVCRAFLYIYINLKSTVNTGRIKGSIDYEIV